MACLGFTCLTTATCCLCYKCGVVTALGHGCHCCGKALGTAGHCFSNCGNCIGNTCSKGCDTFSGAFLGCELMEDGCCCVKDVAEVAGDSLIDNHLWMKQKIEYSNANIFKNV